MKDLNKHIEMLDDCLKNNHRLIGDFYNSKIFDVEHVCMSYDDLYGTGYTNGYADAMESIKERLYYLMLELR